MDGLTVKQIKAWVESLPGETPVGTPGEPQSCLIARYCEQRLSLHWPHVMPGDRVLDWSETDDPRSRRQEAELPQEIIDLAERFDDAFDEDDITAAQVIASGILEVA